MSFQHYLHYGSGGMELAARLSGTLLGVLTASDRLWKLIFSNMQ